jgi:hypothetical protein
MAIHFRCFRCRQRLRAAEERVGQAVRCPACEAQMRVPRPRTPRPPTERGERSPSHGRQAVAPGSSARTSSKIILTGTDLDPGGIDWSAPPPLSIGAADLGIDRAPAPRVTTGGSYSGKTCPFCRTAFGAAEEVTVCGACGIPHHAECWAENGGCTTFGCGAAPRPVAAHHRPAAASMPRPCRRCGTLVDPWQGRCPACQTPVGAAAEAAESGNPDAAAALALAIFGVLIPLLVPFALWVGSRGLKRAQEERRAGGERLAQSAVVLATLSGAFWLVVLFTVLLRP